MNDLDSLYYHPKNEQLHSLIVMSIFEYFYLSLYIDTKRRDGCGKCRGLGRRRLRLLDKVLKSRSTWISHNNVCRCHNGFKGFCVACSKKRHLWSTSSSPNCSKSILTFPSGSKTLPFSIQAKTPQYLQKSLSNVSMAIFGCC